jgi:PAS domain S-box-containing protein
MTFGYIETGMIGQDPTPLFKKVFGLSSDPMLVVLMETFTVVDANAAACKLFGYSHKQFCGLRYASLGPDPVFFRQALVKKLSAVSEVEHMNMEGQMFIADVSYDYLENETHPICLVVLRNVKDQEQLAREKKQLEQIALEVMHTDSAFFLGEDQERKRLGKELHGQIGPMLVSVKLAMEKSLAGERESVSRQDVQKMLAKQARAIRALREVTTRLAEGYEYQEDINLALRTLLDKIAEYGDMEMDCEIDPLPENISMALRYHLFRIVEEGLTNIIKHADANKISIRLKTKKNALYLSIEDDGNGIKEPMHEPGAGLLLMQKRAQLLDGKLRYESAQEKYFKLELDVPLNPGKK